MEVRDAIVNSDINTSEDQNPINVNTDSAETNQAENAGSFEKEDLTQDEILDLDNSTGFGSTVTPPEDYSLAPAIKPQIAPFSIGIGTLSIAAPQEKLSVLLIEDTSPWSTSTNSNVLTTLGISYKKVRTQDFLSQDLGNFSVIIFANDQQFSAYQNYSSFREQIEMFAQMGGVVLFGACDAGWANGSLNSVLPGNVSKVTSYAARNYIEDFEHPVITGELSDETALIDSLLTGNYCSHVYFVEDTLPEDAKVILRDSNSKAPTLVEYAFGQGKIIASGLTWEHNYVHANAFAKRSLDDLFLYAVSIAYVDVNALPPIAISVDAPKELENVNNKYEPNPIDIKALLKNISDYEAKDVNVEIVLPDELSLVNGYNKNEFIGIMTPEQQNEVYWKVYVSPSDVEITYQYQILLTASDGYQKIVTKTLTVPAVEITKTIEYTVFSGSQTNDLNLYGWKSTFNGDVYTGRNFNLGLSEFYQNGTTDAAGQINANGWMINISEKNEGVSLIDMPDFDDAIYNAAEPLENFDTSPAYINDKTIINGGITVAGDVTISSTTFEGDCYIIADGNITYNVQNFNSTGRVVLYSKNGNITINGSNLTINGILYAPKGCVAFNSYEATINGRIIADTINFSGSIFNITGSEEDWSLFDGVKTPVVVPADVSISAVVPKVIKSDSEYSIQINDENELGNLEYAAKFNNNDIEVDSDGKFMIPSPEISGEYILVISGTEPNGGTDTKNGSPLKSVGFLLDFFFPLG
jgi:hypothetical protein